MLKMTLIVLSFGAGAVILGVMALGAWTSLQRTLSETLARSMAGTLGDLESRLQARFSEQLQGGVTQNLRNNFQHLEKVQEYITATELKLAAVQTIGESVTELSALLKLPHLRGGFGEATLERLLADTLAPGQFELQRGVVPGSLERVDAAVKVASRWLPIDSKFPREQVLPLFESTDPGELTLARTRLSEVIRAQAKSIAQKYIRPEHGTTDYALLFLPSETLYAEVIRSTRTFEALSALRVFPTSPSTLALTLHAIASAQDYYTMAEGVRDSIARLQRSHKHLDQVKTRLADVGKNLARTQEAYDDASRGLARFEAGIKDHPHEPRDEPKTDPALL